MEYYNTQEIRQKAKELENEVTDFTADCKACDGLIAELNDSWDDVAYKKFAAKYNEYKETMKNMQECLTSYVSYLNKVADCIEEIVTTAETAAR